MDADSYFNLPSSTSTRFYSQSDLYQEEEEEIDSDYDDDDDELSPEFLCPFCGEDFDFVSLCCHFDEEHALQVKRGVCPICSKKVGRDLLRHITEQHSSLLKVNEKRRYCKSGSILALSLLNKQIQEQSFRQDSPSSVVESDHLLSSFLRNVVIKDDEPVSSADVKTENAPVLEPSSSNRSVGQSSALADDTDDEERVRKSEFVRGLLLSTFMEDW